MIFLPLYFSVCGSCVPQCLLPFWKNSSVVQSERCGGQSNACGVVVCVCGGGKNTILYILYTSDCLCKNVTYGK